nr:MAG TPA: hypothetical protein [Caudoviricetes sp.]
MSILKILFTKKCLQLDCEHFLLVLVLVNNT